MATPLDVTLTWSAAVDPVLAILIDEEFIRTVASATGGTDVAVEVTVVDDATIVTSERTLPARVPGYAKALVGESLRVEETRSYGRDADGSVGGPVAVAFGSAPVRITGHLALIATAAGSQLRLTGDVAASVPFVRGRIERFAAEQVVSFLRIEERLVAERLG